MDIINDLENREFDNNQVNDLLTMYNDFNSQTEPLFCEGFKFNVKDVKNELPF